MKALFTFFFIAFFIGTAAFAQTPAQPAKEWPGHIIGFRAGANLSDFSANDPFKDPYLGYHAGVFLDMLPNKKHGYSLELDYANQGGSYNGVAFSTYYLALPILFNLYASEVALQGGIYGAHLFESKVRDPNYRYYYQKTGVGESTDFGLVIGIKRALGTAGVGFRYYHGLQGKSVNQKLELSIRLNLLEAKRKMLSE